MLLVIAEEVCEDGSLRCHGLVLWPVGRVVVSSHPDSTGRQPLGYGVFEELTGNRLAKCLTER